MVGAGKIVFRGPFVHSNMGNLVLMPRSEMIGSASDQLFWVSGVRFQLYKQNPAIPLSLKPRYGNVIGILISCLPPDEGRQRSRRIHFKNDSDIAGRIRLLTPDPPPAETLNTVVNVIMHITPWGGPKPGPLDPDLYNFRVFGNMPLSFIQPKSPCGKKRINPIRMAPKMAM